MPISKAALKCAFLFGKLWRAGSCAKHLGFKRESPGNQPGPPWWSGKEEPMLLVLVKVVHLLFGRITVRILWHRKGRR